MSPIARRITLAGSALGALFMLDAVVLMPWATLEYRGAALDVTYTPQSRGLFLLLGVALALALAFAGFYRVARALSAVALVVAVATLLLAVATALGAVHAANDALVAGAGATSYARGSSWGVGAAWLVAACAATTYFAERAARRH